MRTPNINFVNYRKSLYNTQKIKRTVSVPKRYIQKPCKKDAEMEQRLREYLDRQEKVEKQMQEMQEKLNDLFITSKTENIYYTFLLYGIKLDKEKIIQKLKARKAN